MDMIWIVLICVSACVLLIPLSVVLWITLHGLWMYFVAVCKRPMKRYIEEIKAREDYVTIDKIAPFFLEAIVVSEDFRFFEHKGYSVVAMKKAFLLNVRRRKIVTGGSGITQQLAKNLYFSFRRIYARKLAELLVVLRLEKYYSKMELLELYVNIIEYGQGCNGIEAAARHYYGHSANELSLWEAVTLAGVLPAPRRYNPEVNEKLAARRAGDLLAGVATLAKMPVEHYCRLWEQGGLSIAEEQSYQQASAKRMRQYVEKEQLISVNRKEKTSDVFAIERMKRYFTKATGDGKRLVFAERVAEVSGDGECFTKEELLCIFRYLFRRGFRVGGTLKNHRDAAWHPLPIRFAFYGERTDKSASALLERFAEENREFVLKDTLLFECCRPGELQPGDLLVTPDCCKEKEHRFSTGYFPPYTVLKQSEQHVYTARGLVKYVKRLLPQTTRYLMGAMGTYITAERIEEQITYFSEWYTKERVEEIKQFYPYAGFLGFDCSGLIKSYYFGGIGLPEYLPEKDLNSKGLLEHSERKGPMSSLPELPGVCLYMKDHVGVYVGAGNVIECTSSERFGNGVVMTKLENRPWEQWFYCPYISYEQETGKRKNR